MTRNSRLRIDRTTNLPSIQSFGELSEFLRGAIADEDSREFSDSMAQLASHIEAIVAGLRLSRQRDAMAPLLMDLLTVLRNHRNLVVALALPWRGLYEYAAYLQALNNFRVLVGQWLLENGPKPDELVVTSEDFELVAWRMLGEGLLLIDMYEQWALQELHEPDAPALEQPETPEPPQVERAVQWWKKLRL